MSMTKPKQEDWLKALYEEFPPCSPRERVSKWKELCASLSVGDVVHGEVICNAPFGVWLNIGTGFPALLKERPLSLDGSPKRFAKGTTISGKVSDFCSANCHIMIAPFDQ